LKSARLAGLVLLVFSVITVLKAFDKAKGFYVRGKQEEERQNYEAAYEDYQQAWNLKPGDIAYRTAVDRTRFLAAAAKVHRGLVLREAGKPQEALREFETAAHIDPSSPMAQQESAQTRRLLESPQDSARTAHPNSSTIEELKDAAGPAKLAAIPNTQITLKLLEDSKVIYETIGKLAGINVLFDPEYNSRRIHVELNRVTLQQSLEIVALESNTFWRPVTTNTIFVAAETPAKNWNKA
jgi:general secretion pathway protein D